MKLGKVWHVHPDVLAEPWPEYGTAVALIRVYMRYHTDASIPLSAEDEDQEQVYNKGTGVLYTCVSASYRLSCAMLHCCTVLNVLPDSCT